MPLGLRGTVVGVTQAAQEADRVYEVLFDREFVGGLSARASGPRMYRLPLMAMINLSHGTRKEPAQFQVLRPTAVVHPVNTAGETVAAPSSNGHDQRTMGQNQVILRHQKFTFPQARE